MINELPPALPGNESEEEDDRSPITKLFDWLRSFGK